MLIAGRHTSRASECRPSSSDKITSKRAGGIYDPAGAIVVLWLVSTILTSCQLLVAGTKHDRPSHEGGIQSPVDTKRWTSNTEFVKTDNWLDFVRPCSLYERIQIDERAVVSISDELNLLDGALSSHKLGELKLGPDGVLLLEKEEEEEAQEEPDKQRLLDQLNKTDSCLDSDQSSLFVFKPGSDLMSWFNPNNWQSDSPGAELRPDSHRIPCSQDMVVFGASEPPATASFKVNFRPSLSSSRAAATAHISELRVGKLKIGDQLYNQQEFERLTSSRDYDNLLFQFDDPKAGLLEPSDRSPLIIDSSSIGLDEPLACLDQAGCVCANEQPNIMAAICSFSEPLDGSQLPCLDPISSSGYCDNLCASVLTISMDPSKFSERFLAHLLLKIIDSNPSSSSLGELFLAPRRISLSRYEITFRQPVVGSRPFSQPGKDQEFARLVYDKLNSGKC